MFVENEVNLHLIFIYKYFNCKSETNYTYRRFKKEKSIYSELPSIDRRQKLKICTTVGKLKAFV